MIKENRLDTVIKTEKRTNVYNLKMKENRFLIMSIDTVWWIHLFLQHRYSK